MSLPELHNLDYQSPGQALVQAYCGFYNEHEDGYQYARTARHNDKLDGLSRYVGLVGMDIGQGWGQDASVDEDLNKLYDGLKEGMPGACANREQAPGRLAARLALIQTVNILKAREDPFLIATELRINHWNIVEQLESNLAAAQDHAMAKSKSMTSAIIEHGQRQRGLINELTAEAVLARQLSPSQISLRALPHHNRNRLGPISYNNLLVTTAPDGLSQSYRIQVKAGCIGACPEGEDPQLLEKHRSGYAPDIVLVSGHCDLDVRLGDKKHRRIYGGHDYPVATLVVEEVCGEPTAEDTYRLNALSASLLQTVTSDTSRRGTARDLTKKRPS